MMPGVSLLFRYDRSQFRHDALAALVVTLVLIPSAFAYADLANCAPAAGLYVAVAGMVVFALFTSSRHVPIVGKVNVLSSPRVTAVHGDSGQFTSAWGLYRLYWLRGRGATY
jgi:MFS superfamily sulfate permease-like transporter